MITFSSDFSEANNFIGTILNNINSINEVLKISGKERLKASNKNSFKQQRDPDGEAWTKSKLSQIDPTGSPRMTMMRSTELYQDTQNDSNYVVKGNSLQEFTTAQSPKGFLYGAHWNEKRWTFAGLDIENINAFSQDIVNHIFKGIK